MGTKAKKKKAIIFSADFKAVVLMLECFFSFLAPIVHLLKVFVRQLKELAISAIIPHHSCNTDLSKRDTSRSGSLAAVIRCSVIFCLLWFCCFSGTFMKHAADPLPPPVRQDRNTGGKTRKGLKISWKPRIIWCP